MEIVVCVQLIKYGDSEYFPIIMNIPSEQIKIHSFTD